MQSLQCEPVFVVDSGAILVSKTAAGSSATADHWARKQLRGITFQDHHSRDLHLCLQQCPGRRFCQRQWWLEAPWLR